MDGRSRNRADMNGVNCERACGSNSESTPTQDGWTGLKSERKRSPAKCFCLCQANAFG